MSLLTLLLTACMPSESGVGRVDHPGGAPSDVDAVDRTENVDDIEVIDDPNVSDDTDTSPPGVTDTFTYARPKVDVLFVIDNSNSMKNKNADFGDAIAPTIASWVARGIDFHAGVVDIDANEWQGTLEEQDGVRWADDTLADPVATLTDLVRGVPDFSGDEAGRRAALLGLQFAAADGPNAGFLRDDAELDIIVHSDGTDNSGTDPSHDDFVAYVEELRPDPALRHFHSVADAPDFTSLTDDIGGVTWGVDDIPYDPGLEEVTQMFHRTDLFTLTVPADPATLVVSVAGVPLEATAFSYDAAVNTVDLDGVPLVDGDEVSVAYLPMAP